MSIGSRRDDMYFQRPNGVAADGFEAIDAEPVAVELVMVDSGGVEALRFGTPTALGYFKGITHYRDDIRASDRMVHTDGRIFQISSYGDPDNGKRHRLQLYLTQIQ